ncbi:MAG: DUF1080 domain-containing protein [Verrucomicrobiales bacterium]|nr:DUF1080 domain-containing protein [Verrucomicrobiales bacterium]
MKISTFFLILALVLSPACFGQKKAAGKIWADPETAASEHPDFLIQGEYTGEIDGKKVGVQAADMDDGNFLVTTYSGGLPGDGWDKSALKPEVIERDALKPKIAGLKRVERKSETLGDKAPEGAIVIFAGKQTEHVKGTIEDGLLWAGSETTTPVGSFKMHLEFRLPFKPGTTPSSQDRGNSGVYIFNNYECQVLDSFALDLNQDNNPFKVKSSSKQWCGSFYKFKLPDTPMVFPPLTWQTYDIDFTAPVFEGDKKVKNARITVKHNGVLIHDDVEMPKGTGAGGGRPEKEKGNIYFQGHGNPVAFRNIWIVEKG